MNKFFNALLLVLFFPMMLFTIVVGFDTPLAMFNTSGANIPFKAEVLMLLGVFVLLVNIKRGVRRWVALGLVNQVEKYKFSTVVSKDRVKRVYVYNFLEAMVFIAIGIALYAVTPLAWLILLAFLISALDAIVFAVYGGTTGKFRVGLTSKALLAGDRDVSIIYFKGLRKVSVQQRTIFFDFRDDLQLRFSLDLIPDDKREIFFNELKEASDETKVYFQNNI